ncbi:MAG: HipA N-terminal domain-containing protein [Deltaproteobacteria bacterium]|nr:HipA N-terminal domain-containing protein [Deltaproteobacteria bacterium]
MKTRSAHVYFNGVRAGELTHDTRGYRFSYDQTYLRQPHAFPISLSFPLSSEPSTSDTLFPFFKGLIPEGWLFELNARALKIDPRDEFGMLLCTGRDCVGAVTVVDEAEDV